MATLDEFKTAQAKVWASFAPLEVLTTPPAATLVAFGNVRKGQRVLDVGTGTGVVAVTAARAGATTHGVDITRELLSVACQNSALAGVSVEWGHGDVEALPYPDQHFDVVLSQFGHMFAPRPEVAVKEMLRVLKPKGTIAFSTWPSELFIGRMFELTARYSGPSEPGAAPPVLWGDVNVIRQRLGDHVEALTFQRGVMLNPTLSPAHHRLQTERGAGPIRHFIETAPAEVAARFRAEYEALVNDFFEGNYVRQDFLMTRATKR